MRKLGGGGVCVVSMQKANLIWRDKENTSDVMKLSGLRSCKTNKEAMDGRVTSMKDGGRMGGRRKKLDDRGVPAMVGGEKNQL